MVQFQKRVKNPRQKWYHFRKRSKILNKNGTISEKCQKSSTEMVKIPKQNGTISGSKGSKFLNKNGIISEKGQKF